MKNSPKILSRAEMIDLFHTFPRQKTAYANQKVVTIGMVGYPNVGKSCTINALLNYKIVSVSVTPGKTKHFQVRSSTDTTIVREF